MSATAYDSLAGSASAQMMLADSSTVGYPASNLYNVFGPVYLPRVYGKDLSCFEIASSGKVSVTLHDTYALDIDRNIAGQTTSITAATPDKLEVATVDGTAKMTLDPATQNLALTAGSNLIFTAQSIVYNVSGDSDSSTAGNTSLKADGDVVVASTYSNVSINAASSNVMVNLAGRDSNLELIARKDVIATASNQMTLTGVAGAKLVTQTGVAELAGGSNAWMRLDTMAGTGAVYALSNISMQTDAGIVTVGDTGSDSAYTRWNAVAGSLAHHANGTFTNGAATYSVTATNSIALTAQNSTSVAATNGALSMTAAASNVGVLLADDYTGRFYATSNIAVHTGSGTASFGDSNAKVGLTAATSTFDLRAFAASNVIIASGNDLRATASNSVALTAGASSLSLAATGSNVLLTLGADSNLTAQAKAVMVTAAQTMDFKIGNSNLVQIQSDKVTINGDLDIQGTVNSINVTETQLRINDKTVQLAVGANADGSPNNAAGIIVDGMPAAASSMDPALAAAVYDKSLKWNYGSTGVDGLLTNSGINTESFWELHGGRFQLSAHKKADGKPISFALRINELDELEMVKLWEDAQGTMQIRRIAKFGRTLM